MRYDNNSYVTLETLKLFNEWIKDVYNLKLSYIDSIESERQFQSEASWKDSKLSVKAVINNIPLWMHRIFIDYMKNNFEQTFNDASNDQVSSSVDTCFTFYLTGKGLSIVSATLTATTIVEQTDNEMRVNVPDGFDGNQSFVELMVPEKTIHNLHRRKYSDFSSGSYTHPLLPYAYGGANLTLNNARGGSFRENALFFYSQFTKNGIFKLDVLKEQRYIVIKTIGELTLFPFSSSLVPLVLCRIKYFKRGIY